MTDAPSESVKQTTLAQMIRQAMDRQNISGNMLAQAAGVSEGTIRNLLKDNTDPEATGPQGLVLKAVCNVLGLDELRVFQAAGFLSPDWLGSDLSVNAEYLAIRFDRLPTDKQELLLGMLDSLEKVSGIMSPGVEVRELLDAVRQLRVTHPMFKERRLALTDHMARFLGSALGKLTNETIDDIVLVSVVEQLSALFKGTVSGDQIRREFVLSVVNHPHSGIVLNVLLPRKSIPSNVEKLYWLIYQVQESPDSEKKQAVKDLWALLLRASQANP